MTMKVEEPWFGWTSWDNCGTSLFDTCYYDVILRRPIGEYPIGSRFLQAMALYSTSELVLVDSAFEEHRYTMSMTIGAEIR